MITASHNPVEDNGVKLIDGDGGMLAQSWERVRHHAPPSAVRPPPPLKPSAPRRPPHSTQRILQTRQLTA